MPTLFFDDDHVQYEEIRHESATGASVFCVPQTSSQILGNDHVQLISPRFSLALIFTHTQFNTSPPPHSQLI